MAYYSDKIKYRYGSCIETTSTEVATSQLKGKSESVVMYFLRETKKHQKFGNYA